MHSSKRSKRISCAVLGLLFTGSVLVLSQPGMPAAKPASQFAILESADAAASLEESFPAQSYYALMNQERYMLEAKARENLVRAAEVRALYAVDEPVVALGSHEPQKLLSAAEAEPEKTVKPYALPSASKEPASDMFVKSNTLNVRKGPGTEYDKVTTLKKGDIVGYYKKEGSWAVIKTASGKVGCVSASYLTDRKEEVSRQATALTSEVTTLAQQIAEYSQTLAGIKYVYAHASPSSGFDCSGFTSYVYAHFGIKIPRSSADYANFGTKVSREDLRASDILLFDTDGGSWDVSHVGIYLGGDKFIHASTTKGKVIIMSLSEYRGKYYGARRVID